MQESPRPRGTVEGVASPEGREVKGGLARFVAPESGRARGFSPGVEFGHSESRSGQGVRRDALPTVDKPSRLAPGVSQRERVRRDALLSVPDMGPM